MKPARFHPEAEVELAAEAAYYEERAAGHGERCIRRIAGGPREVGETADLSA